VLLRTDEADHGNRPPLAAKVVGPDFNRIYRGACILKDIVERCEEEGKGYPGGQIVLVSGARVFGLGGCLKRPCAPESTVNEAEN
jgi:hypothetical protein